MAAVSAFHHSTADFVLIVLSNLWSWRFSSKSDGEEGQTSWMIAIRCLESLLLLTKGKGLLNDTSFATPVQQILSKEKVQEAIILSACAVFAGGEPSSDQRLRERTTLLALDLLKEALQLEGFSAEAKVSLLCRKIPPVVLAKLHKRFSRSTSLAGIVASLVESPYHCQRRPTIRPHLRTPLAALSVLNELVCLLEIQRRAQSKAKVTAEKEQGRAQEQEVKRRRLGASSVSYASGMPSLVSVIGDQGILLRNALLALLAPGSGKGEGRATRRAALGFVCSCLQFEPALASLLLGIAMEDLPAGSNPNQSESGSRYGSALLREVVGVVEERSGAFDEAPEVYASAVGLLRVLWNGQELGGMNQFGALVDRLRGSEDFWTTVAHSLLRPTNNKAASSALRKLQHARDWADPRASRDFGSLCANLTDHCFQLTAKTWALQILRCELRTKGPVQGTAFYTLLKEFQRKDCDAQWLNEFQSLEYTPNAIPSLVKAAENAGVNLGAFDKEKPLLLVDSMAGPADDLVELRMRDYGAAYLHHTQALLNLHASGKEEAFRELSSSKLKKAVVVLNLSQSLADAQLSLMRSWKAYMENRCLVYWQDSSPSPPTLMRTFSLAKQPTLSSPLALDVADLAEGIDTRTRGVSLSPSGGSEAQSRHWGETTSFTLLMCLSKQLGRVAGEKRYSKDLHQLRYLVEIAEMFLSMLHFKLFQVASDTTWSLETEPKDRTLLVKRPPAAKLPLKQRSPDLPGAIDFLDCLVSCAESILSAARGGQPVHDTIFEVSLSLFTAMLLLFQDILADGHRWTDELNSLANRAVDLVQVAFHAIPQLESVVALQCAPEALRETLPRLFEVGLVMLDLLLMPITQKLRTKLDHGLLQRLRRTLSAASAEQFSRETALLVWFERQQLGKITIKAASKRSAQTNLVKLLHQNGIRLLSDLPSISDALLADIGVARHSDRARILAAIRADPTLGKGTSQPLLHSGKIPKNLTKSVALTVKDPSSAYESGSLGKDSSKSSRLGMGGDAGRRKSQERNCRLRRLLVLTRISASVEPEDARKAVQSLSQDPLLRAFSAAPPSETMAIGYTLSGARCMVHQVWCAALRLVSTILGRTSKGEEEEEGRGVDAALDFVAIHRGRMIAALKAFREDWAVLSLAALKEAEETVGLLVALAPWTHKWRLRKELFLPVLSEAFQMLSDLVVGADVSRKVKMLEEFAEAAARRQSKHVPKMCIRARAVTLGERQCNQEHAAVNNGGESSPRPKSDEQAAAGGIECQVSVLHVKLEHRILRIIQLVLTLMRSRQLFPGRQQLEFDKYTKQRIPEARWRPAVIPFPLAGKAVNCNLLLAILSYGKQKLRSALAQRRTAPSENSAKVCALLSRKWLDPVAFVIDNALYLFAFSLDLEMHELVRKKHAQESFNKKALASKVSEMSRRLFGGQEKKEPGILDLIERYMEELHDVPFRKVDMQVYKDLVANKIEALATEAQN